MGAAKTAARPRARALGDTNRFGYLSTKDAALIRDAVLLEAAPSSPSTEKLARNADHMRRELGARGASAPRTQEVLPPHLPGLRARESYPPGHRASRRRQDGERGYRSPSRASSEERTPCARNARGRSTNSPLAHHSVSNLADVPRPSGPLTSKQAPTSRRLRPPDPTRPAPDGSETAWPPAGALRPISRRRAKEIGTSLPPGPRMPPTAQALLWLFRQPELLDTCTRRFGPLFTLQLAQALPPSESSPTRSLRSTRTGRQVRAWL